MLIDTVLFYVFALLTLGGGVFTITRRSAVHSAISLIVSLLGVAGLYLLQQAEFLFAVQIVLYVGGIMVLFLFVVMMLDIDFTALRSGFMNYLPLGTVLGLVLFSEFLVAVGAWTFGSGVTAVRAVPLTEGVSNTEAIGRVLYTDYIFYFQTAGMILLVAMIGAIVLTHRSRGDVRGQKISKQVDRRPDEAIKLENPDVGGGMKL